MSKFMELVNEVVQAGVDVTLSFNKEVGKVYADLNFQAKSHGHLYEQDDGSLVVKMRYDMVESVEDFRDLMYTFKRALHGREFGSSQWFYLCEHYGVLEKVVCTTTTVSYR
jgi:hypothetical protein